MIDDIDTRKVVRRALFVGGIALACSLIAAFSDPAGFFRAYLWVWWLLLCITLGSLAITLIHHMTGGAWGFPIRRIAEAATLTLPLLALLWVPLYFAAPLLYPWAGAHPPEGMTATMEDALRHKAPYLNLLFFAFRAIVYFAVWYGIARRLRRWSREQDRTGDPAITTHLQRFCGPALVAHAVLVSLAGVDWLMSLEPEWFSTMFGFLVIGEQGLCGFAWALLALTLLRNVPETVLSARAGRVSPAHFWDLGSLMFSFLLLWAYMAFAQFLIIWSGNLTDEVIYYRHRGVGGWQWVGAAQIALHFFLPFLLLIWGGIKRRPAALGTVAAFVLLMRAVTTMWEIKPAWGIPQGNFSAFDLLLPVALGGLWIALWARHLAAAPLIPLRAPRLMVPQAAVSPAADRVTEVQGHDGNG